MSSQDESIADNKDKPQESNDTEIDEFLTILRSFEDPELEYVIPEAKPTKSKIISTDVYKGFAIQRPYSEEVKKLGTHVENILEDLFDLVKWVCSRHNEVLLLRYDYYPSITDIQLSEINTELMKVLRRKRNPNHSELVFTDLQYVWVAEKGTDDRNDGIHYHCVIAFKRPDRLKVKQIQNEFIRAAENVLTNKIKNKLNKKEYKYKSKVKVQKILEKRLSGTIIQEDKDNPYFNVTGFFWLKRNMLPLAESKKQKETMIRLIKENIKTPAEQGYKYLSLKHVRKKYEKNEAMVSEHTHIPIGGVLEECIWAISYLAKYTSKQHIDKSVRTFGKSQLKDKTNQKKGRPELISKYAEELEQIFREYTMRDNP